ncbi:MAG: DUF447 domain-containing protein [Rubripirellula sp.]
MILESIVTSVDADGRVNVAPMGPVVDAQLRDCVGPSTLLLRPFNSSRTYQNLVATGKAVVHVTDDVELFAKAAVDALEPVEIQGRVRQLDQTAWWPLRDCHRWFAVEVDSISTDQPRVDVQCRVVREETVRPFFGFNRAMFAVIEAAILATRTHLLESCEIDQQLKRLRPLIEKTGGPTERNAFEFLQKTIDERFASQ